MKLRRMPYKALDRQMTSAGAWMTPDGRFGFVRSVKGTWLITPFANDDADISLLESVGLYLTMFPTRRDAVAALVAALA